MKNIKLIVLAVIAAATLFSSCSKKDAFTSDLEKSRKVWLDYKASVNNSYYYILYIKFAEAYSETKVTLVAGEIVSRDYILYDYVFTPGNPTPEKKVAKEWHETEKTIGTHGVEGGDLYSLDDVYQRARDLWLKADRSKYDVTFEANNNGMVSVAGYGTRNCVDECFIGVKITKIGK